MVDGLVPAFMEAVPEGDVGHLSAPRAAHRVGRRALPRHQRAAPRTRTPTTTAVAATQKSGGSAKSKNSKFFKEFKVPCRVFRTHHGVDA